MKSTIYMLASIHASSSLFQNHGFAQNINLDSEWPRYNLRPLLWKNSSLYCLHFQDSVRALIWWNLQQGENQKHRFLKGIVPFLSKGYLWSHRGAFSLALMTEFGPLQSVQFVLILLSASRSALAIWKRDRRGMCESGPGGNEEGRKAG